MAIMAQWNGKSWEVSSKRIAALDAFAASVKLQTTSNTDAAGSPASTDKALDLQSFNLSFMLSAAAGSDVRREYESWIGLIGGIAPFYLGGKRFGPAKMELTSVGLDGMVLNDFGKILQGKISITLTEYAEEASSKKSSGSKGKRTKAPAVSSASEMGIKTTASTVGATTNDKASKKPDNNPLNW